MKKWNYYNDNNINVCAWIKELIKERIVPDGEVDNRSISEIRADDICGFTQCHFFCGILGWPLALRLAGIPDDFPCWTGSCPCQPFSNAGEQKGTEDERDLWPVFTRLITACKPQYVFGEQVASAIKFGWIDRVHADLEKESYTCGEVVLGAHSVGANHIRQRLYWGAARLAEDSSSIGRRRWNNADSARNDRQVQAPGLVHDGGGADTCGEQINATKPGQFGVGERVSFDRLPNSDSQRCFGQSVPDERRSEMPETAGSCSSNLPPWSDFGLVLCRDIDKQGRHRVRRVPAESVLLGVADGLSEDMDAMRYQSILEHPERAFQLCAKEAVPGMAMLLKGYGNSIVPQLAAEFIIAFLTEVNCDN